MLREAILDLDRQLKQMQDSDNRIVLDGAIDIDRYTNAKPRILWVLREPNGGGPWDLREYLREKLYEYPRWQMTMGLVITVSHGLLNGLLPWGQWAYDTKSIADSLRDVAVININKWGGESSVDWDRLRAASAHFSSLIATQIETLKPEIVVLAGTSDLIPNSIRAKLIAFDESDAILARVDSVSYIRAYHTNQRTITHENYYNSIVRALANNGG